MRIEVHVFHHVVADPGHDQFLARLGAMASQLETEIERLKATTTKLTTAANSAEALISGIKDMIDKAVAAAQAAGATPEQLAQISAVSTALDTEADELAAAVAANIPSA